MNRYVITSRRDGVHQGAERVMAPDREHAMREFSASKPPGTIILTAELDLTAEQLAARPCAYVFDGTDTDGTRWHRCIVHDELAPSEEAACAGSSEPSYVVDVEDEIVDLAFAMLQARSEDIQDHPEFYEGVDVEAHAAQSDRVTAYHEARAIPVITDASRFLQQNLVAARTLSLDDVEPWAQHHAGGLYVMLARLDDGRCIKMHDDWDTPRRVVVHAYDPDAETDEDRVRTEVLLTFETGVEALAEWVKHVD